MTHNMDVLITDSNIWIDLEEGRILCHIFALPAQVVTPDALFHQELKDQHGHLTSMGLELRSVSGKLIEQTQQWASRFPKTSRLDLFALALAKHESGILVTGDAALRDAADQLGVSRHGTLWLIDQFHQRGFLSADAARQAYQRMRHADRRLPWDLVNDQLADLGADPLDT